MNQISIELRSILSAPAIFDALQWIMGVPKFEKSLVTDFIQPTPGMAVLDIGCGTCYVLNYLQDVEYFGFDISPRYIDTATERHSDKGRFFCQALE
jgi:SAM-dependent methyltransferase